MTKRSTPRVLLIGAFTNDLSGDTSIDKTYLKKQFVSPPLGLHRIAQYLGHEFPIDVLDPSISPSYEFLDKHARDYDVIGSSLTHPTLENDFSLLWHAKKRNPQALLLAGGEEAFFNFQQVFDYSPADVCIQGEGEYPLENICRLLAGGENSKHDLLPKLAQVNGLIVRLPDGKIARGPLNAALSPEIFTEATVRMRFDRIPYQKYWDYMEEFYAHANEETWKKTRTVRFFVSNHCPLKCTFCSSTNFLLQKNNAPAKIAWVGARELLQMIINVYTAHPALRTVFFHDDHFTLGKTGRDRAIELSHLVLEAKSKGELPPYLGFMAQCKITDVTPEMLRIMSKAGFWMMSYGIESFSQNILNEFNKNCTVEDIDKGLEDNLSVGISPFVNIILTSANCSMDDVWSTCYRSTLLVARGAEVGMNPYCMSFPGADMLRDPNVTTRVSYKNVKVLGTDIQFSKSDKIIPRDERVQELLGLMERGVDSLYDGKKVSSGRRSNIILFSLFEAFLQMGYRRQEVEYCKALLAPHIVAPDGMTASVAEEC